MSEPLIPQIGIEAAQKSWDLYMQSASLPLPEQGEHIAIPRMRQEGDTIRFRVMPWVWPDGDIYEGVITEVNHDQYGECYHVDTRIIPDHPIKGGIVLATEVVDEGQS